MADKIIAQRPGQFLIQTGPETGRVLDRHGLHEEFNLQSILARGYWEASSVTVAQAKAQLQRTR